ncbi:MAG: leucine-rich repeat protein [Oscillospiraceae bacterium]|nr:leucine-rich repeat protein [Oscillospiraceae bacterium]
MKTKKSLSILLTLALILGLLPLSVLPARATSGSGTQTDPWKVGAEGHESDVKAWLTGGENNKTLTISGTGEMYNGWIINAQDVNSSTNPPWYSVREQIKTTSISGVASIGTNTFSGCSNLTDVTIPDSVTSIGNSVFYGCSGLTDVTIPDSVESIGDSVFYGCSNLASATILGSETIIGSWSFMDCTSLRSVTILASFTTIGYGAFYNCSSLTDMTLPESLEIIGPKAFYGCTGLSSVIIPKGVYHINDKPFDNCSDQLMVYYYGGIQNETLSYSTNKFETWGVNNEAAQVKKYRVLTLDGFGSEVTASGTEATPDALAEMNCYVEGDTVTLTGINSYEVIKTGDKSVKVTVTDDTFTMPEFDVTAKNLDPAVAPTIKTQPAKTTELTYGATTGNTLTVEANKAPDGHSLSYQWYSNETNSSENGKKMSGEKDASYTFPMAAGSCYYYCVVTATRNDNGLTASVTSNVASVTIAPLDLTDNADVSILYLNSLYNGDNPHPTVTYKGTPLDSAYYEVSYSQKQANDSYVEVDNAINVGEYRAEFTFQGNYAGTATKDFTITATSPTLDYSLAVADAVYGDTLASLDSWLAARPKPLGVDDGTLEGSWAWADTGTTSVGAVGYHTFAAVFTPKNTNYESLTKNVTVDVKAKPVTISGLTATSRDYNGERTVVLTGGTLSGIVGDDDVSVDLSGAAGTMADANVGADKAVTVSGVKLSGKDAGNYTLSEQPKNVTVTISAKSVTVTADAKSKAFGEKDPSLTATVTGLVSGEGASLITYSVSREAGEDAGTYTITPSGDAEQGNYIVAYATGTFRIYGVKGTWEDGKLTAEVLVEDPANTLLLAAEYDESGKLVSLNIISLNEVTTTYNAGLTHAADHTYKLMLVSKGTFVPLCKAWRVEN